MSVRATHIIAIVLVATLVAACGSPAPKPSAGSGNAAPPSASSEPAKAAEPAATPAPAQPAGGGDAQTRVTNSLGLLTGSSGEPSPLGSYHIEVKGSSPMLDYQTKEVTTDTTDLKADVQGENVHLFSAFRDGSTMEGYVIGEGDESKEYEVKDGAPQESFGVSLAWVTWPLSVIMPLSLAGLGAQPAGSEAVDGRAADVYDVSMARADKMALELIQGMMGRGYSEARGTVWVDQQTGALLKAVLDWEEDIYDATSSDKDAGPVGHGSGHYEVTVSQVGNVSVSLPQ